MRLNYGNVKSFCIAVVLLFGTWAGFTNAQTKSRIVGTVKDAKTEEAVLGANIVVRGTYLGAVSDVEGRFYIVNVPVGTYTLQVTMLGYTTQIIPDVMVSADRVTTLEIKMSASVLQGQEVVVTAKKDELHKEVSNTQMVVSSDQLMDASGIRQINAFLQKMPGVSEDNGFLTIRGGSADQTGTIVNGLAYNNAAVGNAETTIPMSAVEQVSLLSGGYNAEYGNFRSGLINVTTKSGSKGKIEGSFSFSRNASRLKRFGQSFYDPKNDLLMPYLDPGVAFIGTNAAWENDPYMKGQHSTFVGWITNAKNYNTGKSADRQASPMDMFLLANWLHMTVPDYEGLSKLPDNLKTQIGYYEVMENLRKAFTDHHMVEEGTDWNFDGGFGGPIPLIGKALGNATFFLSNSSLVQHYIQPVARKGQQLFTTLGTIKSTPRKNLTLTYNGLWKRQIGISAVRPAYGDSPDASREGGFLAIDNVRDIATRTDALLKYAYDPPFFPLVDQTTLMNGITVNHVLNPKTFWELTLSYLTIEDHSPNGDNRDSTVIAQIGPFPVTEMPYGKLQFGSRSVRGYNNPIYVSMPGMTFTYLSKEGDLFDNSKVRQFRSKFDIASQINDHHYVKGGVEYNYIDLKHDFWEKWNNNAYNTYEFNYHRWPSQTGVYVQNQVTYNEIVANIGVRFDYYYGGGGKWPSGDPYNQSMFLPQKVDTSLYRYLSQTGRSYIWDVWTQYDRENPGFLQPIKNHYAISPRIGLSFPITTESKFYFNYGHFRSNPPYYTMYQIRYRYDKNGLYDMTNPNLVPPRTIQYELGVSYNFIGSLILSVAGYAKDVTGEAGTVNYRDSEGKLNYPNRVNNQYQDVQGIEVNLSKSDRSWLTGWINFNYMLKKNGLTGRRDIYEDPTMNTDQMGMYSAQETKSLPRPEVNTNLTFISPAVWGPELFGVHPVGGWNLTLFGSYTMGSYFTYNPLNKPHVQNNVRWPDYYMVDSKLSKVFRFAGVKTTFYMDISNVFNIKVNQLNGGYAFYDAGDRDNYLKSLHLPMYDSPEFDEYRTKYPGLYIGGKDKIGDLRSSTKPYINDPNYSFWIYKQPRDIWFGLRFDF